MGLILKCERLNFNAFTRVCRKMYLLIQGRKGFLKQK